jgi:site-specific recombinase XerD
MSRQILKSCLAFPHWFQGYTGCIPPRCGTVHRVSFNEQGIDDFNAVTKEDVSDYITKLRSGEIGGRELSNASFARNLSSLKSFYRYLNRSEGVENNPVRMFHGGSPRRKAAGVHDL